MTKYTIYKKNVMAALKALADYDFQKIAWFENEKGLMYSFSNNISDLFDDYYLEEALYDDTVIVFGVSADKALRELNDSVETVIRKGYLRKSESFLIQSTEMQIVREIAAKALALVEASDGSESTVEIIE